MTAIIQAVPNWCQACNDLKPGGARPRWPGGIALCDACAGPDHRLPLVKGKACPRCGHTVVVWFDRRTGELNCCTCSHVWMEEQ